MTCDEIRARFANLNVWQQGDQRAPHKPLLLLLALGRVQRGEERLVEFSAIEEKLKSLLMEFGPQRRSYHPHFPFWHLQADGVWELKGVPDAEERTPGETPNVTEMRRPGVEGGFPEPVDALIRSDPECLRELAQLLLDTSFTESLHEEIAAAVGVDMRVAPGRRDPAFRERILIAYGFSCAVCGFDLRLGHVPLAVEAAHIKWHQAGGRPRRRTDWRSVRFTTSCSTVER